MAHYAYELKGTAQGHLSCQCQERAQHLKHRITDCVALQVGHSLGGLSLQKAVETLSDRIERLVFVDALILKTGAPIQHRDNWH